MIRYVIVIVTSVLLKPNAFLIPLSYHRRSTRSSSRLYHSKEEKIHHLRDRRTVCSLFLSTTVVVLGGISTSGSGASASNLPKSNGANLSNVGTVETLLPLVQLRALLRKGSDNIVLESINSKNEILTTEKEVLLSKLSTLLDRIPREESKLKKLFDEYSDTVSYKQKYLDQNAFLVYYTRGFDGPNRPTIEQNDNINNKQMLQYGARNDVWATLEDIFSILQYYSTTTLSPNDEKEALHDLKESFERAIIAMDSYLELAPPEQLLQAENRMAAAAATSIQQ